MASYADPKTTAQYDEPYAGAMRRGFLESAAALAKQPIPIPVQQIAGLDPYQMQARALAGGLGGFTPYLQQGAGMAQQGFGTMQQGAGVLPMAQQMYGQGAGMYGQATGLAGQAANMFAPRAAQQFYNGEPLPAPRRTFAALWLQLHWRVCARLSSYGER